MTEANDFTIPTDFKDVFEKYGDKNSSIAENILRETIKEIKNGYPAFSYNDLKKLAFKDDVENGTLHLSLDTLHKFLNDKIK